jgi:hypothetical protein
MLRSICQSMKILNEEQRMIAGEELPFQYLELINPIDTIPFVLYLTNNNKRFVAYGKNFSTTFFRLESLDEKQCQAELTLLKPIDLEGNPVNPFHPYYSLQKTNEAIIVNLNRFSSVNSLPVEFVHRPLPIIEPK